MRRVQKLKQFLAGGVAALFLTGCATSGVSVSEAARPSAAPQPAQTRFESSLQCMDGMFSDFGVSGVSIAVSGVPDYTGRAYVSSDIWLQTAITKMSQRSNAFVVTDFNPNPAAPEQSLWSMIGKNDRFYVPAYYVRGAISGFTDDVTTKSAVASIGGINKDIGAGASNGASLVSVDLTIGDLQQRTLIARAHAGNEVSLQSRSAGLQLGARVQKLGANLDFTVSRNEGVPQAVRALVELGAIEILGRLTGAPYWSCLDGAVSDAEVSRARQEIFSSMSGPERIVFAQRRLARLGLYKGELNGQPNPALTAAASSYAMSRGIAASEPGAFALYQSLTDWRPNSAEPISASAPLAAAPAKLPTASAVNNSDSPLRFEVWISGGGNTPGAPVTASMRSSKTAFGYCYLQDKSGAVSRVFPNRWQPDPLIQPTEKVDVPGPNAGFQLVLPNAGSEQLSCFAASQELSSALPAELRGQDLTPLPVASLGALAKIYENAAKRRSAEFSVSGKALAPK